MFESYSSLISLHGVGKYEFPILCILIPLSKKQNTKRNVVGFKCSIIAIATLCEFLRLLKLRLMKRILDKIILMPNILRLQI